MKAIFRLITAASLFFAAAGLSAAQSQMGTLEELMAKPAAPAPGSQEFKGSISLFDSVLIYPMPDWMPRETQGNPMSSLRLNRRRGEKVFLLEMLPKEEPVSAWRNLYAVMGLRDYPGNNATHARDIVRALGSNCKPSNLNTGPLKGNPRLAVVVVACGSFAREPDKGEVAAFVLLQRGTTAVRLYRQWRGPAFRSEDPEQWPVKREAFERIIRQMTKARLTPLRQLPGQRP